MKNLLTIRREIKIRVCGEKKWACQVRSRAKAASRFKEHPQVIPRHIPGKEIERECPGRKKADSVTETIRSAWRGVTLAAGAGFARGCQRGRNRGCRFEQELGCYANWKDNNRLSEDGCVDGLADERGTTSLPGKHADLPYPSRPSFSLAPPAHPRIAHPDLPQGKLYSLPSTYPRHHRPSNTLPVPSAFIPFRVSSLYR